ncbi:tyrosine-type recombinase/integrase [Saccharothrix variisporea]|uniref:tyrosine-type recombinase/integrase n=1 Tax=Saccharothrix variisporea TaxID=543527 RepID=UPI001FE658E2|nr:tyrosine-type recombinase/integrase [Saccharothrix variisporea]
MTTGLAPCACREIHLCSLHRFHSLTAAAGLPRIRVHDLRHFAATTMLNSRVPLAVISRAMRHSNLSTTTEVYGHLLRHVAHDAVDVIANALHAADQVAATAACDDHTATT